MLDGRNLGSFDLRPEELQDETWIKDGSADLGRIEHQQQFVIAAIDRAIARGFRNRRRLRDSSTQPEVSSSTKLDPAELIDLADAFTNFSSDTLERYTRRGGSFDDEGRWEALGLAEDLGAPMFQVFRGGADGMSLGDVRFSVAGVDAAIVVSDTGSFVRSDSRSEPSGLLSRPASTT